MENDYLMHWGIRGQKWNRSRYQTPDGTWTDEGLRRRRAQYQSQRRMKKGRSFAEDYYDRNTNEFVDAKRESVNDGKEFVDAKRESVNDGKEPAGNRFGSIPTMTNGPENTASENIRGELPKSEGGNKSSKSDQGNKSKLKAYDTASKYADAGIRRGTDIIDRVDRRSYNGPQELAYLSDDEIRAVINRAELEQKYMRATGTEQSEKAKKAKDFVDTVGDVVAITTSIAGMILAIRAMKSGGLPEEKKKN